MNDQEALEIVLTIVKEWLDDAASSSGWQRDSTRRADFSEAEERIGQTWMAIEEAVERVMTFVPPTKQDNGGANSPAVYSVVETAALLGVGRNLIYEAVRAGRIPSFTLGTRILVPKAALERIMTKFEEAST